MDKEFYSRMAKHKGIDVVELAAEGYYAIVAPSIGSNVLRFRDNKKQIEVFRYSNEVSIAEIMNSTEIWGLPTLYLPNRFDRGILKTSEAVYRLPENESMFKNHIHGFIQKRVFKVKEMGAEKGKAFVVTEFTYDENDFFYNCFPIKFTVQIKIELSKKGLLHTVTLVNNSDKMLPVSLATHTTINAPFVDGGKQENMRLNIPIGEKIIFNKKRWLPTEKTEKLNSYDLEYKNGTMCPVLKNICNDMYTAEAMELDGKSFHGCVVTDIESGKKICYETDEDYKYWIVWNHEGFMNYFCPEPMTAQVNAPNLSLPREKTGYKEIAPTEVYSVWQRFFTE
jgi:aldose 1-epimerase